MHHLAAIRGFGSQRRRRLRAVSFLYAFPRTLRFFAAAFVIFPWGTRTPQKNRCCALLFAFGMISLHSHPPGTTIPPRVLKLGISRTRRIGMSSHFSSKSRNAAKVCS